MIRAVGVIVPVHDEADLLPACLAALAGAVAELPPAIERRVIVVLDACSDRSAEIAREADVETVVCDARNVGRARALGAARVLERFEQRGLARDAIWLATTDADTRVPRDWLVEQLRCAEVGAHAVAGAIAVDDWSEHPPGLGERFARFYADGGEYHPHVHGANLGVRADAYVVAGGFAPLATGEDHALWRALADRPRIATRKITVVTSARRRARAPDGFAGFLVAFAAS